MSTENEAGSSVPAAESAAAPDGAPAAQVPAAPAAPPAPAPADHVPAQAQDRDAEPAPAPRADAAPGSSAPAAPGSQGFSGSGEQRTEVLPTQAPPPVGPPSPYGPPPSELAGGAPGSSSPFDRKAGAPSYEAPQHQPQPPQPPYYQQQPPAAPAPGYGVPTPSPYGAPQAGHPGQPGAQGPEHQGQGGQEGQPTPVNDPYAVPSTPSYATPQPGPGGPGSPGGPVWGTPMPPSSPSGDGRGRRRIGSMVAAVLVAALVAGGVGGGIGYYAAKHNDDSGSTTVSAASSSKALNRAPTSVAGIANKVLPSVVTIKAQNSQESDTGTGFVFDKQGHILTNNHVVAPGADSGKLTVTFSNGKTYDASIVGRAQGYDVAVIKLKNPGSVKLSPLPLGNSDQAAVGDATIAVGAPYGLSGTVTTGIVSAVHRPVASSDGEGSSASYMSAIQTDASINPGNSGGPLLNAAGAVIGINSAIQPGGTSSPGSQGGSVGLGFAIPINQAKRVADQLIQTGQPVYPVIGVSLNTQYEGDGAEISTDSSSAISANGPGEKAGLKPGDVITKFDGTLVDSGETLIGEIWQHKPGDQVTLTYTRDGSTHTTTVTLGSRKGDSDS
ncbi:putative serine protease PepD [Actinacidiphila yanglinensis]|uniref:Putative serine protease PepD n=1 Tax=Actinacidiphila yanglinensis TaxID=310779 RepID=A0A1H6ABZ4_9ACTN|nr:trypsin-like peptidase domain-containing protein [Actinacidiphila yanglinensis]SEG45704.1 putative serine protease PepD [Actinacidiphila yanglinensis]